MNSFFCCQNTKGNSYLQHTNHLRSLIENAPISETKFQCVKLFGKSFNFNYVFKSPNHLKNLFCMCMQTVLFLKKSATCSEFHVVADSPQQCRQDVCEFLVISLDYLQNLRLTFLNGDKSIQDIPLQNSICSFIKELKRVLLFCGRLSDILASNSTEQHSKKYIFNHMVLDIWWLSIEILNVITLICRENCYSIDVEPFANCTTMPNLHLQITSMVLWDLCHLALIQYKNVISIKEIPFSCPCIKDFWIKLIVLCEHWQKNSFCENFLWIYKNAIQNENVNEDDCTSMETFYIKKSCPLLWTDEFFVWLMYHVTILFKYDLNSTYVESRETGQCMSTVKTILQQALAKYPPSNNEKILRQIICLLHSFAKFSSSFEDILLVLAEYYLKWIDHNFSISASQFIGVSPFFENSKAWMNDIENLYCISELSPQENSFHLYLRLLAMQLSPSVAVNLWRQLKGRIFCKFTPKKLREMSGIGLQNCFSLFLTLSNASDIDVALKMCHFGSMVQDIPGNFEKQIIALKAIFALIFWFKKKEKCEDKVISTAAEWFDVACAKYSHAKGSVNSDNIMSFLVLYIDCVKEIFDNSTLKFREHILIGRGLSVLLPACTNEVTYFLESIIVILTKMLNIDASCVEKDEFFEEELQLLSKAMFDNVYPFIKQCALSHTISNHCADIAAIFTCLSLKDLQSIAGIVSPDELFNYFGNDANVNVQIICRYLNMLQKYNMMDELSKAIPNFTVILMQSWLMCCYETISQSNDILELGSSVLQSENIVKHFQDVCHVALSSNHTHLCISFFQKLESSYLNCISLQEKHVMQEMMYNYFKKIPVIISKNCQSNSQSDAISHVYRLSANLVQYCAPLLYQKIKADTLLPEFINRMLFPMRMSPKDTFLPAVLGASIKKYLPFFLKGLAKINNKNDPFIKRKIKEIQLHYLITFPIGANNPIVLVTIEASLENKNLFTTILENTKEQFDRHPSESAYLIKFCIEIMKNISSASKKLVCNILLEPLLNLCVLREGSYLDSVKELLNSFLFAFLKKESIPAYREEILLSVCKNYIEKKVTCLSTVRVFQPLIIIADHFPEIILKITSPLTKHIETLESKNCGNSNMLRDQLGKITGIAQSNYSAGK